MTPMQSKISCPAERLAERHRAWRVLLLETHWQFNPRNALNRTSLFDALADQRCRKRR